ncbi:hypothetical protein LCGC14_0580260 [marine sediment metagenome]|uniref:Response regulatory domain-containing protein n=1 Tax=marine sediment metagenome TaxID=412755 RepID=A0A0F9RLM7_9ZZZZ
MALRKENILIVDDDIDILELLQRHLKSMNYHTYKAISVKEALFILKDTFIDLLIYTNARNRRSPVIEIYE